MVLRRLLRLLSPWVQWRWCSRCTWEGPRLRGPDLGPLDPPVDHDSGFRWGNPDYGNVPDFLLADGPAAYGKNEARPDHISGFKWQAEEEPTGSAEPDSPDSPFPPNWEMQPPHFPWGPGTSRGPGPPANAAGSDNTPVVPLMAGVQESTRLLLEGPGELGEGDFRNAAYSFSGLLRSDGLR